MSVALVVLVVVAAVPDGRVGACSCVAGSPSLADQVGAAEIAFVGRLDVSTVLSPSEELDGWLDRRYELVVEDAVKGVEVGDRVVMFGSSGESSCGTSLLDEWLDLHAVISSAFGGPFIADSTPACARAPSVDELTTFDPRPPPTSAGQLSVVVAGRVGEAELVGYDAAGHALAYGDVDGVAGPVRSCPAGKRVVLLEQSPMSGAPDFVIRDAATLQVTERIPLDLPSESSEAARYVVVPGAELTCLSEDGGEAVVVLPWENTLEGPTLVISVRPADSGGAVAAVHGRAGRATFDPAIGGVVAVADGALVRLDLSGARTVVARLSDPATEPGYGALFLKPIVGGGWWVGLGDGDDELPTRLRTLAHVDPSGSVERWPVVETGGMYTYDSSIALVDGALATPYFRIPLPVPGTSQSGIAVLPEAVSGGPDHLQLADGRSVRLMADEQNSVQLVGPDGSVTLDFLAEVRSAAAIPDGPFVEPGPEPFAVDDVLVVSRWIERAGTATAATAMSTTEPVASVADGSATTSPGPSVSRVDRSASTSGDSSSAVLIAAAVVVVSCAAIWWTRRRRNGVRNEER